MIPQLKIWFTKMLFPFQRKTRKTCWGWVVSIPFPLGHRWVKIPKPDQNTGTGNWRLLGNMKQLFLSPCSNSIHNREFFLMSSDSSLVILQMHIFKTIRDYLRSEKIDRKKCFYSSHLKNRWASLKHSADHVETKSTF